MFINRLLRLVAPQTYLILVNGEEIGTVRAADVVAAKELAEIRCDNAERELNDFFFEITAIEEPELGCTHIVRMAARGSGRLLEQFTTDDPFGAVEAAREAQAYSLEERFEMYAEMGL